MVASKVKMMQIGGKQLGEFFLVVEIYLGGSATNEVKYLITFL